MTNLSDQQIKKLKTDLSKKLKDSILTGPPGAHDQENIMMKTSRFLESFKNNGKTYRDDLPESEFIKHECLKKATGERTYQHGLILPEISQEEVLKILSEICGLPPDIKSCNKKAWVSEKAFMENLIEAVKLCYETAIRGGTILLGTGHPNLMKAYAYIVNMLKQTGADIYYPRQYFLPTLDNRILGSQCGVTVLLEEYDELWYEIYTPVHTHNDQFMELILKKEKIQPDLVFADHGFAGTAIRNKIPTISIVDTNDIDLLIASSLYSERVFPVPIHDNADLENSFTLAVCFELVLDSIKK